MKKHIKALPIVLLAVILAVAVFVCIPSQTAYSEAAPQEVSRYYSQLSPEAKRLYDAIGAMDVQGLLKQGNARYDLIASGTLSQTQLENYSSSSQVMAAFGAARDAYYLDHPEVFYIDFSRLSISVGTRNGEYVATLGSGRANDYYIENGFSSETDINYAIAAFDSALDIITETANAFDSVADKIKSVNSSLIQLIEYSFCSSTDSQGNTSYTADAPHIRTAYGALVNGKAVCEGYARAFKCAMHRLGIDCIIVQGYAQSDGGLEPHAWNYVRIDGSWYGVDATWNDGSRSGEEYLLRGDKVMSAEHITDGVISSANFNFLYPALNPYDYGFVSNSGLNVDIRYQTSSSSGAKLPIYSISKDGKNVTQLQSDGLWTAYKYCYEQNGEFVWSDWTSVCETTGSKDFDAYTEFYGINNYVLYVQFALIGYAPDSAWIAGGELCYYAPENLKEIDILSSTEVYGNEGYGTYLAPPYVKSTSPQNYSELLDATKTYDIVITYTENLRIADENAQIGMSFSAINADAKNYAEISDIVWNASAPDTITFKFTPSAMYQHRDEAYSFIPTNLIGEHSEKTPMPVTFYTTNDTVVCNKVFDDGRLYINSYGKPSIVSAGDLSMTGWKDENGNYVSQNQRSQLMLVATSTSQKQKTEMIDNIIDSTNLENNDVLSAQTFEIELNICKNIVKIPNGSSVQVAFGFPEGYGPDDEGVTFKVYHFRRGNDGKIDYSQTEELECVITQYGLIVNVSDFSPFAVIAVSKDKVEETKSVYARVIGFGGNIINANGGSAACVLSNGDSVTYTITPENGYRIAKAVLNGNDIELNGNSVTLNYADLSEKTALEVHFVADSVAEYETSQGITAIYPSVVISYDNPIVDDVPAQTKGLEWYHYLIIVLSALIVIAGIAVLAIYLTKRKPKRY